MWTLETALANEKVKRLAWEAATVAAKGEHDNGPWQYTIAELRACFDRIHIGQSWKDAFCLAVANADLHCFCEAVTFFHGERPTVRKSGMSTWSIVEGNGYAC